MEHVFKDYGTGLACVNCGIDKPEPGEWAPSCDTVRATFGEV